MAQVSVKYLILDDIASKDAREVQAIFTGDDMDLIKLTIQSGMQIAAPNARHLVLTGESYDPMTSHHRTIVANMTEEETHAPA